VSAGTHKNDHSFALCKLNALQIKENSTCEPLLAQQKCHSERRTWIVKGV
jgi:hypothetical protein